MFKPCTWSCCGLLLVSVACTGGKQTTADASPTPSSSSGTSSGPQPPSSRREESSSATSLPSPSSSLSPGTSGGHFSSSGVEDSSSAPMASSSALSTSASTHLSSSAAGSSSASGAVASALPAQTAEALQAQLEAYVDEGRAPGTVMAVDTPQGGWVGAAGLDTVVGAVPMDADALFRVGSITKTFTAALVLLLQEDGLLNLQDTLDTWFPDFPNAASITLVHLLNHTSGLADYLYADVIQQHQSEPHTAEQLVAVAKTLLPDRLPGEMFGYSNTNYVLLGLVAEAVGGASWAQLVRARILEPLGLHSTFMHGYEDTPPFARGYSPVEGGWRDDSNLVHPTVLFAAGSMVSTPLDMARWFGALNRGNVLSEQSLRVMREDHRVPTDYPGIYAGLGIFVEAGDPTWGALYSHTGGQAGYSCSVAYLENWDAVQAACINVSEDSTKRMENLTRRGWGALLQL